MIDFPCAVHLENYDEIKIATDEAHLKELRALGYITSAEWYETYLNVVESDTVSDKPRRGRPPKSDE
jgi:hypothetical protein